MFCRKVVLNCCVLPRPTLLALGSVYSSLFTFVRGHSSACMDSKTVVIRTCGEVENELNISFNYDNQRKEFNRNKSDLLGKTLQRIALKLQPKVKKKKNIGQIHLLKETRGSGRYVCVLNTHLYYKRHASHIRLLQISALLNHLKGALDMYQEDIPVIVLGDFNSLQGEPLLPYLSGAEITQDDPVWKYCLPRVTEEDFTIHLKCPIELTSLSGFPEFTSYVPHCKATLDYIYGDTRYLTQERFVPIPKASEIDVYTGVPCIVYPSDHFAVVLDLKWNEI